MKPPLKKEIREAIRRKIRSLYRNNSLKIYWNPNNILSIFIEKELFHTSHNYLALVHFKIVPHTVGHDVVGLLALVVYGLVPMFFLIRKTTHYDWFFSRTTDCQIRSHPQRIWQSVVRGIFIILLAKGLFLIIKKPNATTTEPTQMTLIGFQKTILPNGICQFSNDSFLIYVKPLNSFYTTEHSPMICWRGSGFVFKQIEKKRIGKADVYTGILAKGDSTIHAAW